jgi:hypothetical protein
MSKTDSPCTTSTSVGRLTAVTVSGAAGWGGRTWRRLGRRTEHPMTAKMMVRACCEMFSWTCNNHCTSRCRGWCQTNTRRRRLLPRPLPRTWWHGGGDMRGERKEAGWRTRWRQLRRGPSLSCGGIYNQMGRVWWVGPRHGPFNSAWASPARALCRTWAVASGRSVVRPNTIIFFYFTKNHIYICQFIFNIKNN